MATNLNPIFYVNPINLGGNEVLNFLIEKLSAAPESPVAGRQYFNTTDNKMYYYNGTTWVDLTAASPNPVNVIVNADHATLADYVIASYDPANFNEGDLLVLTTATDPSQRVWVNLGTNVGDETDFIALSNAYDQAEIRAMFSGISGINYNSTTGEISVKCDNTTIGLDVSGNLEIKDDSITKAKIAADVAGLGLVQNADGSLEVNVDGVTLEVAADVLQVKDGAITEDKLSEAVKSKLNRSGQSWNLADTGVTGVAWNSSLGAFVVTHNFNTTEVAVVMRDNTNNLRQVPVNNDANTVNTVRVYFAEQPTNNQYRITVVPVVL
ncbi:MAG: hypothetical protein ACRDAG_01100 [Cetobacterium somerae]|uniref:hypothetical protein n=2 Tax=Cetobacterium TaxID=180162 RepID=UPI003F3D5491